MSLNYRQVIAAMGSAVAAALLASAFGAKGTIIGVAIGAGTATVLSALLTHSLDRAHGAVREVLAGGEQDGGELDGGDEQPGADHGLEAPGTGGPRLLTHPYLRLVATGVFVFVLALMAVTGLELVIGRPLPTIFGVQEPPGAKTSVGVVLEQGPAPRLPDPATTTTTSPATTTTSGSVTSSTAKRSTTTSRPTTTTTAPTTSSSDTTSSTTTSSTAPAG